jgi:hypothetical protein
LIRRTVRSPSGRRSKNGRLIAGSRILQALCGACWREHHPQCVHWESWVPSFEPERCSTPPSRRLEPSSPPRAGVPVRDRHSRRQAPSSGNRPR